MRILGVVAWWVLGENGIVDVLLERYHVPLDVAVEVLLFHPVLPLGHFFNDSAHIPNCFAF